MSRQLIPAIMTSVVFVSAVMATFALAFCPGGFAFGLASASGSDVMNHPATSGPQAGESRDITKSNSNKAPDSLDECFQTCRIDETRSRFMKSMCQMGCAYSAYGSAAGQ